MNLHISRVRRGSTVYVYGQLVESHRRPDGMPSQKVIANLGRMSDVEIENLRLALEASRRGARVILDKRKLPSAIQFAKPMHNLRYLDLAVLRELWCEWGLDKILDELLPTNEVEVRPGDVVAALAFQRCVDPGSKLHAERWFPRTALPELLGIAPAKFNNTRLHRILDQLDDATPSLMQRLPRLYRARWGEFSAMFLDVTDAHFVGQGPEIAEKARTKEGVIERKIGIVLLCNDHGYPLRWKVIAGKRGEASAMQEVFAEIRGLDWVGDVPVVCDRIMGCSAELAKLLGSGVRFVTSLRSNEWASYASGIPHAHLANLQPTDNVSVNDPCGAEAARLVVKAGMQYVSPTLYVLDLGVIERDAANPEGAKPHDATLESDNRDDARRAMMLARQIDADQATVGSLNAAARRLGTTVPAAKGYRRLLQLGADLQQEVIDGRAAGVSLAQLYAIAKLPDGEAQRSAFDRVCASSRSSARRIKSIVAVSEPEPADAAEAVRIRVRVVVAFNPELFVDQRRTAQKQIDDVQLFVRELNERLARPRARQTQRDIEAAVDRMLRRRNLLEVFKIRIDEGLPPTTPGYQVHVELDPIEWQRRRRHDGFSVIVAHPAVVRAAGDLCQLYRDKDAVEKDFQIIKGLVRLRPIWHHTDAKVRAHVTLCMLALLLERTLNERLKHISADHALETFATCCLNRFQDHDGKSHYMVTQPDESQQALLRQLRLAILTNDNDIIERVLPR
ncbi:MAG: IS1634 family transposase [Panacagrimonas sp.]